MSDDDTYAIPLQDQRVFGAGIKRKRVQFVRSTPSSATTSQNSKTSAQSVGDVYLKLVLPGEHSLWEVPQAVLPSLGQTHEASVAGEAAGNPAEALCDICNLALIPDFKPTSANNLISTATTLQDLHAQKSRPHEASLAHQVCLAHSHPPSHIDRNRKGLNYLSSYGWDPDSRLGLGAQGQGMQFPIKTKPKDDKMGIGVVLPREAGKRKKEQVKNLDAGKIKKMHDKDKQKSEKLRDMFYRNDNVEQYLGAD